MSDCLVTKLKGVVNDGFMPRLGKILVYFPKKLETQKPITGISIATNGDEVECIRGSFSNSLDQTIISPGEKLQLDSRSCEFFPMEDDSILCVSLDKITAFRDYYFKASVIGRLEYGKYFIILDFSSKANINFSNIKSFNSLTLKLNAGNVETIYGDVSNISWTEAEGLYILNYSDKDSEIYGDFTTAKAAIIQISNASKLTCNIAKLSRARIVSCAVTTALYRSHYTWDSSNGATNPYIVAMEDVNLGSYVDPMLVDQATRTLSPLATTLRYSTIQVRGKHTMEPSVYEAAIASLQEKGVTVSITLEE